MISREFLRMVCEPFFEQMLTALQQALQQQQKQCFADQAPRMQCQSWQSTFSFPPAKQLDPMPDVEEDDSTDADDCGAFASLLSGPSSEDENSNATFANPSDSKVLVPELQDEESVTPSQSQDESDQANELEKSTMVCRHWKSKGWCRLGSSCKFQHPEHKRGMAAAPKSGSNGTSNCGSNGTSNCGLISGTQCPGIRTTLSLIDALGNEGQVPLVTKAGRKKNANKARSLRVLQEQEALSVC